MNNNFINELVCTLEECTSTGVKVCGQKDIFNILKEKDCFDKFPMISFEKNGDNHFQVDPTESKFLNDSAHSGTWLYGVDWFDDLVFIMNLKEYQDTLYIDAYELNTDERGQKLGLRIALITENVAEESECYRFVAVEPFDTNSLEFWKYLEYKPCGNGKMVKDLGM